MDSLVPAKAICLLKLKSFTIKIEKWTWNKLIDMKSNHNKYECIKKLQYESNCKNILEQ